MISTSVGAPRRNMAMATSLAQRLEDAVEGRPAFPAERTPARRAAHGLPLDSMGEDPGGTYPDEEIAEFRDWMRVLPAGDEQGGP